MDNDHFQGQNLLSTQSCRLCSLSSSLLMTSETQQKTTNEKQHVYMCITSLFLRCPDSKLAREDCLQILQMFSPSVTFGNSSLSALTETWCHLRHNPQDTSHVSTRPCSARLGAQYHTANQFLGLDHSLHRRGGKQYFFPAVGQTVTTFL